MFKMALAFLLEPFIWHGRDMTGLALQLPTRVPLISAESAALV